MQLLAQGELFDHYIDHIHISSTLSVRNCTHRILTGHESRGSSSGVNASDDFRWPYRPELLEVPPASKRDVRRDERKILEKKNIVCAKQQFLSFNMESMENVGTTSRVKETGKHGTNERKIHGRSITLWSRSIFNIQN